MYHIPHAAIYPNQILQYNNNQILERSVYYFLLIDQNGQVNESLSLFYSFLNLYLDVGFIKNLSGYWTTVKAHRRIKNDRSLETPQECLSREFN